MFTWIEVGLIGLLAGSASGFLGIGGGIVMVPLMVFLLGYSQKHAQGTSIAVLIPPIGIFAAKQYYDQGFVNVKVAAVMAVFFAIGSYLTSSYISKVPDVWLKRCFGLLLAFVAGQMLSTGGWWWAAGGGAAAIAGGMTKQAVGKAK